MNEGRLKGDHNIGRRKKFDDEHQYDNITHSVMIDVSPFDDTTQRL